MELFLDVIKAVRLFSEQSGSRRVWDMNHTHDWPTGGRSNIVLKNDLGLELGSPDYESVSSLLWTETPGHVSDGRITLVGPDFSEYPGKNLPLGKIVIVQGQGFDVDNAYERHRNMDELRYNLDLKGFMLRAVSQFMREWCRISISALKNGFNVRILGSSLLTLLRAEPYVTGAEVIYFTSSKEDVIKLRDITTPAERIIVAMNKMAVEMDFDCSSCEFQSVCNEATELRAMQEKLKHEKHN